MKLWALLLSQAGYIERSELLGAFQEDVLEITKGTESLLGLQVQNLQFDSRHPGLASASSCKVLDDFGIWRLGISVQSFSKDLLPTGVVNNRVQ